MRYGKFDVRRTSVCLHWISIKVIICISRGVKRWIGFKIQWTCTVDPHMLIIYLPLPKACWFQFIAPKKKKPCLAYLASDLYKYLTPTKTYKIVNRLFKILFSSSFQLCSNMILKSFQKGRSTLYARTRIIKKKYQRLLSWNIFYTWSALQ